MNHTCFELEVNRIGNQCTFRLARANQPPLLAEVDFPEKLEMAFKGWQAAYLDFYLQRRAQMVKGGSISEPKDRRSPLIVAEDKLRGHLQDWLRQSSLHDLQAEIVAAATSLEPDLRTVDVFLTCWSEDIARLPWETWEMGTDPKAAAQVRIARTPINIKQKSVKPIRRQARALVIMGTAPELDLSQDLKVILDQLKTLDVKVYEVKPGKSTADYLLDIQQLLQDSRGWDMLFFAGHSDESTAGGQLGLAPQVSIHMNELQESLEVARQNGLQFAFFNSCNGLKIAEMLIQAGIGQVVVMREPLPDEAAPLFLKKFLEQLAQYQDVQSALRSACQDFSSGQQQTRFPSISLVPSLFRHPQSQIFCIQPYGLQHQLQQWLPTGSERRWLALLLLVSLIPVVQDLMLEPRILLQAVYQQTTGQEPQPGTPPVLLVEIDENSLQKTDQKLINNRYLNYGYLADLIDELSQRKAKVIGIDYILDQDKDQPKQAQALKAAIQRAEQRGTRLVFGGYQKNKTIYGISGGLANLKYHKEGDLNITEWVTALPKDPICKQACPFAYQLAHAFSPKDKALELSRLHPVSKTSHAIFQNWFEPIIDFSVPEPTAYDRVSACSLVDACPSKRALSSLQDQVVLIVHGGYEQGGLNNAGDDMYTQPLARAYLATQNKASGLENFLGGEAHAYSVHHFLRQHLVVPIPDSLMVLLAAVLGKGVSIFLVENPDKRRQLILISRGTIFVYIFISLQVYFSGLILMPIGLPFITYFLFSRSRKKKASYV